MQHENRINWTRKNGLNLALNAKEHNFDVVGFDVSTESVKRLKKLGLTVSHSVQKN